MKPEPFFQIDTLRFEDLGAGQARHVMHLSGMSAMFVRLAKGTIGDATHHHPHEQIAYIIRGKVRMFVGDQTAILAAGSGYRIPGDVPHHLEALEDTLVMDCFSPKRDDLPATV
jgi:quercetin dioxygenase-like cupin family protein